MRLSLIGYRGTGKTTVAAELSQQLAIPWQDADVEIERTADKSIAEIFADDGEPAFRDLESAVLKDLCQTADLILSVGGGAVLRAENRQILKQAGPVIWLQAKPDTIRKRMEADPLTGARRPNLTAAGSLNEVEKLLSERTPLYAETASLTIDTEGKSPAEIAAEILTALPKAD